MKNSVVMKVDHEKKVVLVTKAFMKASQKYGTEAFDDFMDLQEEFRGYKIRTAPARKKPTSRKAHFRGLTYKFMEEYIKAHDQAEDRMKAFEEEKLRAKPTSNPYKQVQDWFLDIYPEMKIAA